MAATAARRSKYARRSSWDRRRWAAPVESPGCTDRFPQAADDVARVPPHPLPILPGARPPPIVAAMNQPPSRAERAKTVLHPLTVNGETRDVPFLPHETLLEVLRERMGLTGTKHGCE